MKTFTNIDRCTIAIAIFFIPILCSAENSSDFPLSFPSVEVMIKKLGDYNEEIGTFKIIKQSPLHIQLSPQVAEGETSDQINEMVERAIVYGVYRTFIHTNVDQITVTALPKEMNLNKSRVAKYVYEYKRTVSKTRNEALALAKKHLGISSFPEMVSEIKIGNTVLPYQWTNDFKRAYYNDKGFPGLTGFVNELSK